MSEPVTQSELSQVLDAIQGMQASLQAIEKKLDIHIATSGERFQRLEDKIDAVEAKLEQRINAVEAKLEQRINAVEAKLEQRINAVEAQLSQHISSVEAQLGQRINTVETTLQQIVKRQDGTDARLWGFLVTLLVLAAGLITKLLFFDTPRL
ncbi:apolipoprotein A1/A4/E family protein [Thermosynechococcus sp. HN-54]|uniref:apolipoprotein A1/A4/E family protein n=1 Tax=Thermosynechococcus sp. HN-54 TaxID=2933959 RepID=UPI00202D03E5|nr:apolipoprotein A1/A4/E family protein [Thermosynechococcus sp. HN-54]URR34460.1 apolipoprotein A1/A4/E family protein [Thermosynechococcus sp. HN-54]